MDIKKLLKKTEKDAKAAKKDDKKDNVPLLLSADPQTSKKER